jgi:hypothetical protein
MAQVLEDMDEVACYVKNQNLGFAIPYTLGGEEHHYLPDFIVRIKTPLNPPASGGKSETEIAHGTHSALSSSHKGTSETEVARGVRSDLPPFLGGIEGGFFPHPRSQRRGAQGQGCQGRRRAQPVGAGGEQPRRIRALGSPGDQRSMGCGCGAYNTSDAERSTGTAVQRQGANPCGYVK